jgi:spermidine/putrescine transport system substrate-binding protein
MPMNRKRVSFQRILFLCLLPLFALATLLLVTGCGGKKERLFLYNWSDYIDPQLIREFEKEFGVRVVLDTYDSNETMYAKVRAGGGGYDLIVPTSYMAKIMWEQGMLREIDHSKLSNLGNLDRELIEALSLDPEMRYTIPYMIGHAGVAYRDDRVTVEDESWAIFGDTRYAGRMIMLDDMREVVGAALKFLGYSLNTINPAELEEALEVLLTWRPNIVKFDSEQYKGGLASGEFWVAHGYGGDVMQVMEEAANVSFFLPKEGFALGIDDIVIPVDARNPDLAYKFIDFLLRPDVAARNIEAVYFLAPNKAAYPLVDEDIRADPMVFITPEKLAVAEVIEDLGENNRLYISIWDRLRAAR